MHSNDQRAIVHGTPGNRATSICVHFCHQCASALCNTVAAEFEIDHLLQRQLKITRWGDTTHRAPQNHTIRGHLCIVKASQILDISLKDGIYQSVREWCAIVVAAVFERTEGFATAGMLDEKGRIQLPSCNIDGKGCTTRNTLKP